MTHWDTSSGHTTSCRNRVPTWSAPLSRQHEHNAAQDEQQSHSLKRTKHIKMKYIFIEDKVDQREVTIEHCLTGQMWTDINTKPKQGMV
jgi:hypothetical protein